VQAVLDALQLRQPAFTVITVAGTNGKGSTAAFCDAILRAAGYRVGLYTSPHLIAYNERICIDGQPVTDRALCSGFERVEAVRGAVPLTYFEYGTVVALDLFRAARIDIAVLEVGMGGRLDAVNAIDADVAIVTAVDIDHTDWLGPDRETIGAEKAGIMRAGRPAIVSDPAPPQSVIDVAKRIGARLLRVGQEFTVDGHAPGWQLRIGPTVIAPLPAPALHGDVQRFNAAAAIVAIEQLRARHPVRFADYCAGLTNVRLRGRFDVRPGPPVLVLDVAHNPQAVSVLARNLAAAPVKGRTLAVFSMLGDKDIGGVAAAMATAIDVWHVATVQAERAAPADRIASAVRSRVAADVFVHPDPRSAFDAARANAGVNDRIVVFGSFYMVGDILAALE